MKSEYIWHFSAVEMDGAASELAEKNMGNRFSILKSFANPESEPRGFIHGISWFAMQKMHALFFWSWKDVHSRQEKLELFFPFFHALFDQSPCCPFRRNLCKLEKVAGTICPDACYQKNITWISHSYIYVYIFVYLSIYLSLSLYKPNKRICLWPAPKAAPKAASPKGKEKAKAKRAISGA